MLNKSANPGSQLKQTVLAGAIVAALGGSIITDSATAANLVFNFSATAPASGGGLFTMLDPAGFPLANTSYPYYGDPTWGYGLRSQISGTFTIDTNTMSGSMDIDPFEFFDNQAGLPATAKNITFIDASSDPLAAGNTLLLANMQFDWNGNTNIPVSLIWNANGLITAINGGLSVGDTVATGCPLCVTPASDGIKKGNFPVGPVPIATTSLDPTHTGGANSIGQLPIAGDDGIGGSPMQFGPFNGFNANFDFTTLTLYDDGTGPTFTTPSDLNLFVPAATLPFDTNVDLGTVADEAPRPPATGVTSVEYSTDGGTTWTTDDGTNTISVTLTQPLDNKFFILWRATDNQGQATLGEQVVTVGLADSTPPVITVPADVTVDVTSTADSVCFGAATATDDTDPNPRIEWSHDGFNWNTADPSDNCSTGFGPNVNTMNWRAIDAAGNIDSDIQNVTLNLPAGITGAACVIDLATAGPRLVDSRFIMRTSQGSVTGDIDLTVKGDIDTAVTCSDPDPAICNPNPSAASLVTKQSFFQFLWSATPIRLFGPGTWEFETCLNDGSTQCTPPRKLSMEVKDAASNGGVEQLGAHMLFDWGATDPTTPCGQVNCAIDVVVVWNVDCNEYELTASDPDGDGVLGTQMVDGPFQGFNAAFDLNTQATEPPIADGGYTVTVPVAQNPVAGESPIPVTEDALPAFNPDPVAVRSCVGDCYKFTTTDLLDGDDGSPYQYAQVVLPLSEATPFWSQYRKYDETTGTWRPFVINGRNDVKTAPLEVASGECPAPGDGSYDRPTSGALADKLREGDSCVQVTIEDGGPNDADGAINGSVSDPGGVAELPAGSLPSPSTSGGGCSISAAPAGPHKAGAWWLLAGLLGWLGWKRRNSLTR